VGWEGTYSLLNGAELLELGAESSLIRVPRKASVSIVSGEVDVRRGIDCAEARTGM
jgi:hypothetical protein